MPRAKLLSNTVKQSFLIFGPTKQKMRHFVLKLRYCLLIILINCILVPIFLRYYVCDHKDIKKRANVMYADLDRDIVKNEGISKKPRCTPKKNIVFIKTHKAGSSTVTNILNRYGETRGLNFVLPKIGQNRLDWPWYFQMDSFHPMNGSTPNILCNHARYNKKVMNALMPNDTLYITILRDPVTQFESTFSYMTLDKILGMDNSSDPLEKFFVDPQSVLVNYVLTQDLRINSDRLKLIRNGMFYDLGLESRDFDNKVKIREAIEHLDAEFDFVMIKEYFDESLVLLKQLLCLELDDLVYFNLNERRFKRNITSKLKNNIRRWSYADVQLYNHFNKTFWKVLNSMGPEFWEDVKLLRYKSKLMADVCLRKGTYTKSNTDSADIRLLKLRRDIPFVARTMCERMTRDEVKYLKELRILQDERNAHQRGSRNWRTWIKSFFSNS